MPDKNQIDLLQNEFRSMTSETEKIKSADGPFKKVTRSPSLVNDLYKRPDGFDRFSQAVDEHIDKVLARAIYLGRNKAAQTLRNFLSKVE